MPTWMKPVAKPNEQGRPHAPVYVKPPMDQTKTQRIKNAVQPAQRSGRLLLHEHLHPELKREIETFPTGLTNDLIDALAGCIALAPPIYEPQTQHTTEAAVRTYLKALGLSENELGSLPSLIKHGPGPQGDDPLLKITRERFTRA